MSENLGIDNQIGISMKRTITGFGVLILIFLITFVYAEGDGKGPVLYTPLFEVVEGSAEAGTAFAIKHNGKYYIVSAQHLIGTAGGLTKDYLGRDMTSIFKKATFSPIYSGYKNIESSTFILIKNAEPISDSTAKNDIFIAPIESLDSTPLTLANKRSVKGDRVTLYSRVASSDETMHKATVARSSNDELVYVYDDENINLRATSGAPILNESYQVVGINLAGGDTPDGRVVGWANPYESIISNLPTKSHNK